MKKVLSFIAFFVLILYVLLPGTSLAQQRIDLHKSDYTTNVLEKKQLYSGSLWGWGRNELCQLGDGTNIDRYDQPIQIGNDTTWKVISCGRDHSIGIKSDGTLWVCGHNYYGELGTGTSDSSSVFIQNGTENNWKYVVTGNTFTLAMKKDGSLWGWGNNAWGTLADSTFVGSLSPVKSAQILWGNIKYLTTGESNCAAITNDGSLWMWGSNTLSTLGDGTQKEKCIPVKIGNTGEWLTIGCSALSTVAIKKDGTLWRWGSNYNGHLREGTASHNSKPKKYGTDTNWAAVSVGNGGALALKKDGTLWTWGENNYGRVGDGTTDLRNTPVQIGTDNDWDIISAGWLTSFATKKDGSLWSWGLQSSVENPIKYFLVPTRIENMEDVIQLSLHAYSPAMFLRGHLSKIPEIVTLPITKITKNSAKSGGDVLSDDDEEIIRGICFGTTSNPTINNTKTIDGSGLGNYQSDMIELKPFTKYYVRAYATNSTGTGYGQEESFVTKLLTPILIAPENKATKMPYSVTFLWKSVENALNYKLQLSQNDKFSTFVLNAQTGDTSYNYKNIQLNTQYFWRVQALNGVDSSDWSDIWTFNSSKFDVQGLISPVDNSINIPIDCQLNWDKNGMATSFILQVSKDEHFSSLVFDTCVSKKSFQCEKLDMFTYYNWRVKSLKGIDSSDWSPTWHFTTLMDAVCLNNPMDLSNITNIEQNFSWEEGIYKKDYRLQISRENDFRDFIINRLIVKNNSTEIKQLDYWQKYFWRVRNESGDTLGYWSEIWQFKTRMSDMLLMYPENTQTGLEQEINFKWNPVVGAEFYQLQISKNDQFTDLVYSKDSLINTEQFVPNLESQMLYYWRVRVWNTELIGTAYWSEVWTFRTGGSGVKDESDAIKIIPNPAGDFITITFKSSEGTQIQIYNTLGEKVMTELIHPMTASHRMNITDLPKGVYFVKIGGETAKFVKM
jgi:alpha-tubulin suppressor-like RCC1 family protein